MNVNIKQNNYFVQDFIYSFVYLVRFLGRNTGSHAYFNKRDYKFQFG